MSWLERDENLPCCPGLGAVTDEEFICRILVRRVVEPLNYEWISKKDLFPVSDFSNKCGEQDGLSVDRSSCLSDCEIWERSERRAKERSGRVACSSISASVSKIRKFQWDELEGHSCKIFDDPLEANAEHAVLRANDQIPIEERSLFVAAIKKLFDVERGIPNKE